MIAKECLSRGCKRGKVSESRPKARLHRISGRFITGRCVPNDISFSINSCYLRNHVHPTTPPDGHQYHRVEHDQQGKGDRVHHYGIRPAEEDIPGKGWGYYGIDRRNKPVEVRKAKGCRLEGGHVVVDVDTETDVRDVYLKRNIIILKTFCRLTSKNLVVLNRILKTSRVPMNMTTFFGDSHSTDL